ncbi:hypothetical protein [Leptolyngbya sp. KIOST-1]|uniref:hypothetical protein n=1 Tax=Leptolyngbya sp. KIOST-1 TaxID=1229172 RepID=UPI000569E026|nr:hypothetical protein [Leptolyngbya sp. KIOST-1]
MATRLWNFLIADLGDLGALASPGTADAVDVVLGLAAALAAEDLNIPTVAALVNQLDSLLDAINSPLGKLVGANLPLLAIGAGLIEYYVAATQTPPTPAQAVALASQAAYLESFCTFARQHPKIEQWLRAKDNTPRAKTITLPVKALGIFELTEAEARLAAGCFHQSALAAAFNRALIARLVQLGTTPDQASRITAVVARHTNRHLRTAIAAAGDLVPPLLERDRPSP